MLFDKENFLYDNHEVLWYTDHFLCYIPTEDELYNLTFEEFGGLTTLDIRYFISVCKSNDKSLFFDASIKINPKYYDCVFEILNNNFALIINDKNKIIKIKEKIKEVILMSIDTSRGNEEDFINSLNEHELEALKRMVELFNCTDFYISVNKETQETNISGSAYRSLFYKLKENKIATVESAGVKGTHVIFHSFTKLKNLL